MAQEARDPVCGMMVDIPTAQYKSEFRGKTYYFCAAGCKTAFERNPEQYLGQENGRSEERGPS